MHNYFIAQIISQSVEAKYILLRASDSLRGTKQSNLIATLTSAVATAVTLSEVEGSPFATDNSIVATAISVVATHISTLSIVSLSVAMATPGVSIRNSGQAIKNKT